MTTSNSSFDVNKIRLDFPILKRQINGQPLIYFDNAATSQKPQQVIDAIVNYYQNYNANIHRGVHALSQEATDAYEKARRTLQLHFNIPKAEEVILTSGTTHSINIVASGYTNFLKPSDEVLVSAMEHHSNIVPWQMLCERSGAKLLVIPMNPDGTLDMTAYSNLLGSKTKLVFVNHVSNTLGTINPIQEIVASAHKVGATVLVDGAQACSHLKIDVQALDVDFYVASAHKMCGPTGVGMLYGKTALLEKLPPYQGGGEMISEVTFERTTYAELPHKFEAGTPNICGGIAFGAAIDYLNQIGLDRIAAYEDQLLCYATSALSEIEGLTIYGNAKNKTAVLSFNVANIHPYDIGVILDKMGIAVRTGQHCTQPIMDYFGIPGTVRASFAFYNTEAEIDSFIVAVKKAVMMLT